MLVSIHWLLKRPKEWLKLPAWHDTTPIQCKQHNTIPLWPWTAVFCDNKRNKHGNWVSEDSNYITINKLMQIFQIRGDFSKDPTWLSTLTSVSKGDEAQMAGSQACAFSGFPVRAQVLMEAFTQNPSGENVLQKKWFFVQVFQSLQRHRLPRQELCVILSLGCKGKSSYMRNHTPTRQLMHWMCVLTVVVF